MFDEVIEIPELESGIVLSIIILHFCHVELDFNSVDLFIGVNCSVHEHHMLN